MNWVLMTVALVVSFLFSGIESGLLSLNRVRLRHHASQGDSAALLLDRMLEHPQRLLAVSLIVTNLMNVGVLVFITLECVGRWGMWGYVAAGGVAMPVWILLLEMVPKLLFRRFPYRLLTAVARLLRVVYLLLVPLLIVGGWFGRAFLPRREPVSKDSQEAREHFKQITSESERHGELSGSGRRMIHRVVDLGSVVAKDVMVPLEKVVSVAQEASVADVRAVSRERGVSRMPVIADDGQIVGLVDVFDALLDENGRQRAGGLLRRIVVIAPREQAYEVMRKLRAARLPMAAVVDGTGKPLGIVCAEDIVQRFLQSALEKEVGS